MIRGTWRPASERQPPWWPLPGRSHSKADNPLIDDPFAEPLVRAVGIDFFTRWVNGDITAADVDAAEDAWGLQRMADLMSARTRYFDGVLSRCHYRGHSPRPSIFASGLDARAYRLSWPAGVNGVRNRSTGSHRVQKRQRCADLDAHPTAELRAVPIDLRHDWPTALRAAGFDAGQPSAWIAEGLARLPAARCSGPLA